MSLTDGELHAFAGVGLGILTGGMVALILATSVQACGADANAQPAHDPLDDMEAIEASIAYRKSPAKQPQKKTRLPDPVKPPDGITRDDTLKTKKPDKPDQTKPDKPDKDFKIPDRKDKDNPDDPVNDKPSTNVGEFNDSNRGFAEVTSGDPYFRELAADFHESWEFPSVVATSGNAAACIHLSADGTIVKTKVDPRSDDEQLNGSLDIALSKMEKKRNQKPDPVPTHLLKSATTRWICFKANKQDRQ